MTFSIAGRWAFVSAWCCVPCGCLAKLDKVASSVAMMARLKACLGRLEMLFCYFEGCCAFPCAAGLFFCVVRVYRNKDYTEFYCGILIYTGTE